MQLFSRKKRGTSSIIFLNTTIEEIGSWKDKQSINVKQYLFQIYEVILKAMIYLQEGWYCYDSDVVNYVYKNEARRN